MKLGKKRVELCIGFGIIGLCFCCIWLFGLLWFLGKLLLFIIIYEVGEGCICSFSGNNILGCERGFNCVIWCVCVMFGLWCFFL